MVAAFFATETIVAVRVGRSTRGGDRVILSGAKDLKIRCAARDDVSLRKLFDYDDWANREEIRHLRSLANPPKQAIKILAHIVGTEWLFLGRLRSEKAAVVWPDLNLDQIAEQIERLHREWPRELDRTDVVEYVNSKGEKWSSRGDDILMHVVIHGAYHRGQIATLVRQSGDTPAYTDYIHCIRSGFVSPED